MMYWFKYYWAVNEFLEKNMFKHCQIKLVKSKITKWNLILNDKGIKST